METMTLFGLLDRYAVLVPSLQRNYVHGNDDVHAREVRMHFVALLRNCCDNGAETSLGVVYGVRKDAVLIPIDGQQRLTTLWLAAVYATNASPSSDLRMDLLAKLSRFSYQSRPLASTFCRWLTSGADIDFDMALTRADECWGEDPTVHSMITTLRLIHQTFKTNGDKLLSVLHGEGVHFDFSEVHGDDSDLYVKINARGRTLTQWETFKGAFAGELTSSHRRRFESEIEVLSDQYFARFGETPDGAFFSVFARISDYVQRRQGLYDPARHEHLSVIENRKGVAPYIPVEEFELETIADTIAIPFLQMTGWALGLEKSVGLWYWDTGEKSRSIADILFAPENANEHDFALFLFEYFSRFKEASGMTGPSFRALRFVANILENVVRESGSNAETDSSSPAKQFNRVAILSKFLRSGTSLYDAGIELPGDAPVQCREEMAKGRIYESGYPEQVALLNECESYMHGRVRIALFAMDLASDGWDCNLAGAFQTRLVALKRRCEKWKSSSDWQREGLLKELIGCESWNLKDQLTLSTGAEALRKLLSTRDDVHLQATYLDGSPTNEQWKRDCPWRRDWRINVFAVENWNGRTVKWHAGTGTYFLYEKANIQNAMPIADWRFDLRRSITSDFAELGKVESVTSNDGGTRSFRCCLKEIGDSTVNVYLWKEQVEIRWFNYRGEQQESAWIPIRQEHVDGSVLAGEIVKGVEQMKDGRP